MTTNKDLEPIAKQVSLLNRLIELLRMQDDFYSTEWIRFLSGGVLNRGKYIQLSGGTALIDKKKFIPESRLIQKNWSDELVWVAREYLERLSDWLHPGYDKVIPNLVQSYKFLSMFTLVNHIRKNDLGCPSTASFLEAILNRYGRSLSE